jgi:hypothetical protein
LVEFSRICVQNHQWILESIYHKHVRKYKLDTSVMPRRCLNHDFWFKIPALSPETSDVLSGSVMCHLNGSSKNKSLQTMPLMGILKFFCTSSHSEAVLVAFGCIEIRENPPIPNQPFLDAIMPEMSPLAFQVITVTFFLCGRTVSSCNSVSWCYFPTVSYTM